MATKTFEELKQLAIQIRDEKTKKSNTATRIGTQMLEHLNKLEQEYYNKDGVTAQLKTRDDELVRLDKMTTEYNVSVLHPSSGIGGSNKYTLETAIAQVPSKYRSVGLKCSFINESGTPEIWEYKGGLWNVYNFIRKEDDNIRILEWETDWATTVKKIPEKGRKKGMIIIYNHPVNGYILEKFEGTLLTDAFWTNTFNWSSLCKYEFSKVGFEKFQINKNSDIGISSNYFTKQGLEEGQVVSFKLICDDGICDKYTVIERGGNTMFEGDAYQFEPNKLYAKKIKAGFTNNKDKKWGPFINAVNAIGNGEAVFIVDFLNDGAILKIPEIEKELSIVEDVAKKGESAYDELNISLFDYPLNNGYIGLGKWITSVVTNKCIFYPLSGNGNIELKGNAKTTSFYCLLGSNEIVTNQKPVYTDSFTDTRSLAVGQVVSFEFTEASKYLYLFQSTEADRLPEVVKINGQDVTKNIKERLRYLEENSGSTSDSFLKGKTVVTLCDSLGEQGIWQHELANIHGMIFDDEQNRQLSKGGTQTLDKGGSCGMDRTRKLKELNITPDYIIYENINDGNRFNNLGSKTDVPFFLNVTYNSSKMYIGFAEAVKQANVEEEIKSKAPKVGAMILMRYQMIAKKFTINSKATANGQIIINIGDDHQTNIEVTTGMTIENIVDKIVEVDYSPQGYADVKEGNNAVIFKASSNNSDPKEVTINVQSTGVVVSTEDVSTSYFVGFCFTSYNVSEWNDYSKWKNETEMTLWSVLKGEIEYLYTNFPKSRIFYAIFPRLSEYFKDKEKASSKRADGSLDWDNYEGRDKWAKFYQFQRDVAEYMQMPVLDVVKRSNINYYNGAEFYPDWNVHFLREGYKRVGETIARELPTFG